MRAAPDDAANWAASQMDGMLTQGDALDARSFAAFQELQHRIGLTHGGRPLCQHLRPYVITARDYAAIAQASEQLAAALGALAERSVSDPALAAALGLSADERALGAIDPGYPQALAIGRFDLLVSDRGFDFIELNADSPAGITDQLLVERALFGMPHVAALREHATTHSPAPHVALIAALRELYAAWGGRAQHPTIALVDWQDVATAAESQVIAGLLREAGHEAFFADPAELEYDGKRLSARGEAIDIVYRRVIVQELLERCGMEHALIRAYRERHVCVANSFRTKALNKKASFAVLSDPAFGALFSPEQRAAIAAHVPWTRRLSGARTTDAQGREVALAELLQRERENLVLKPNDEYGGKGVLLGWRTSPERWAEAVQGGAEHGMIVQERRVPRMIRMPSYRGGLVFDDLYFDLCPFVFAGRAGGMMIRVSTSPVTNVSTGGEVSGLLVIDDTSPPAKEQTRRV
jgi:glutathionylspermidine synthase